jgi:predicted cupin superfamily sugar epimerase
MEKLSNKLCTVAPGFVPEGFEMADPDWQPDGA